MHDLIALIAHKALSPTSRLHWIYLGSALAMAVVCHWVEKRRVTSAGMREFLFPRNVWLHRSAITDYVFVLCTLPLFKLLIVPLLFKSEQVAAALSDAANGFFGAPVAHAAPAIGVAIAYTLSLALVVDFKLYWIHRLFHRIPALWEFHKVHHSAEVLTPLTYYRSHPVEMLFQTLAEVLAIGLVTGVFLYAFPGGVSMATILGINGVRFLFLVLGANLRHSHIWLSFGRRLEHIFISPAQHQIHHSAALKHRDRNFGSEFAIWDWLFGTLYLADKREPLTLGLDREENRRYGTTWQLLIEPFRRLTKTGDGARELA